MNLYVYLYTFIVIVKCIPIEDLREKYPKLVGYSKNVYNMLSHNIQFEGVFPKMIKHTIQINRINAKKNFEVLYNEMLKLDQNLADNIDIYIDSNLQEYNKTAYKFLLDNKDLCYEEATINHSIKSLINDKMENESFKFLTYLFENSKNVEKMCDNILLYLDWSQKYKLELTHSIVQMLENIKQYDKDGNLVAIEKSYASSDSSKNAAVNTSDVQSKSNKGKILSNESEKVNQLFSSSDALNSIEEIPNTIDSPQNDEKITKNEELLRHSRFMKFLSDSKTVEEKLAKIKNIFHEISLLFNDWNPWISKNGLIEAYYSQLEETFSEFYSMVGRIQCTIIVTFNYDIRSWDCDKALNKEDTPNTTPWSGSNTKNYFMVPRKLKDILSYDTSKLSNSGEILIEKHKYLPALFTWANHNLSTKNILSMNNIALDVYLIGVGSESTDLLKGAKNILYWNCLIIKNAMVNRGIHNIQIMKMYLYLFYTIFLRIIDLIERKMAFNTRKNVYVKNMESNIVRMIHLINYISNDNGQNGDILMKNLKMAVKAEYGNIQPTSTIFSDVDIKYNFMSKPIMNMTKLLTALKAI